jgi:hypothetical protein
MPRRVSGPTMAFEAFQAAVSWSTDRPGVSTMPNDGPAPASRRVLPASKPQDHAGPPRQTVPRRAPRAPGWGTDTSVVAGATICVLALAAWLPLMLAFEDLQAVAIIWYLVAAPLALLMIPVLVIGLGFWVFDRRPGDRHSVAERVWAALGGLTLLGLAALAVTPFFSLWFR